MNSKSVNKSANIAGVISAGLCMVHCVAFPVLFTASVLNSSKLEVYEWLHYLFIGLAFISVYLSTRQMIQSVLHYHLWVWAVIFSVAILLHHQYYFMIYVSFTASSVLLVLHILNHLYGRHK